MILEVAEIEHKELPIALQDVQSCSVNVRNVACCGSPENLHLPADAKPDVELQVVN